ncbi:Lipid phosphate phosphatase 2 [Smittium mucronatum]|uniref:Lipid phosphate phosphatase 2 n=1 Tax=Smittium mucronatum TaxID=133383 RepID=A0A1R0H4M7_9FUNG|nr:Lipid phosphate phosphatase 2 [Smittium mucronatum]OLY84162.1 Lipid phosphate phosphatase 2 [Smittium mucronatum]
MLTINRRYFISYLPDWVVLAVVAAASWGIGSAAPYNRDFSLQDNTIKHAIHPDTIPFYAAVLISFIFPLFVIAGLSYYKSASWYAVHIGVLSITLTQVITLFFTSVIKNLAGRPRPDFLARCIPDLSKINDYTGFGPIPNSKDPFMGFYNRAICTNTDKSILYNGMRSFPSGHASASFCGLIFLSLFLASHLRLYNGKGYVYKAVLVSIPPLVASIIAVSRTFDNRHHWQDVLIGSILGSLIAFFCYYIYYPNLSSFTPFSDRFDKDNYSDVRSNERMDIQHSISPV